MLSAFCNHISGSYIRKTGELLMETRSCINGSHVQDDEPHGFGATEHINHLTLPIHLNHVPSMVYIAPTCASATSESSGPSLLLLHHPILRRHTPPSLHARHLNHNLQRHLCTLCTNPQEAAHDRPVAYMCHQASHEHAIRPRA